MSGNVRLLPCLAVAAVSLAGVLAAAPATANPSASVILRNGPLLPGSSGSDVPASAAVTIDKWTDHTVYRPTDLGTTRHPVVIWGNGTGVGPGYYEQWLLEHWAAAGFVVVAANTTMANSGAEMLVGGRELLRRNDQSDSVYYGKIATDAVAAAGHSQGGAGAINAGADDMVRTVLALQPGPLAVPGDILGPTLFLAGGADRIVDADRIVKPLFDKAGQVPAIFAELGGAGHLEGRKYVDVMTDWLRYQLLDDAAARARFVGATCGLCTDAAWTRVEHNEKAAALG
ncbi:acetylxylan esterase [Nocardia sp. NPDC058658]|uniref:poly(ethylene terephthalate) hydrolase family protein n=1 Tax=Nocardia sp. NPDC058658 TaxID=3346580 RepID=UPI00365ACCFC